MSLQTSSSTSPTTEPRRSARLKSAQGRIKDINQLLSETNPVIQLMKLLNRFSVSPVPAITHSHLVPFPSPSPTSSPNPLGSNLLHLNISTSVVPITLLFQVISGCGRLERLGLFNVTVPPSSALTPTGSMIYREMKSLKSLQLKMNWQGAQDEAMWSSTWFSNMVSNGLAFPNLSRLRFHRSDSGVSAPIRLIHLIWSHAPFEQLDIEGDVESTLPAAVAETRWGNSLRQLEISVARREDIQALESFLQLNSLETLVLNGLADIIASFSSTSESKHSISTDIQDIEAKEAWLSEIFDKVREFCKQGLIANLVLSDLGDNEDTYGPAWRVIARYTTFLETEIKDFRVWARKARNSTPIRAVDYIENGRGHTIEEWRQTHFHVSSSPTVAIS